MTMRRQTLLHLVSLTALWALFFWRFAAPDPRDRWAFADGDFTQQFGVFRNLVYQQLAQGRAPLWADCLLAGYPLHADPQTQLFYFPSWVTYVVLRIGGWGHYPIAALTAEAMAHYLLVSFLLYAFLRGELRRPSAALFGAVVFTYGGYLTGFPVLQTATIDTLTWLPLALICLRKLSETGRTGYLAGGALALALAYFGGHPQTFVYVGAVAAAYLVFRARAARAAWRVIAFWTAGLASLTGVLAAVQLLPSLQFLSLSTRASIPFEEAARGFPFQDILQFLITGLVSHWQPLYLGILPLALALFAGLADRRSAARFWAGVALTGLILSFGAKAVAYDVAFWTIPLFKIFRGQEHFSLVVAFSLSVLAGYGAEAMLGPLDARQRRALRGLESAGVNLIILSAAFLAGVLTLQRAGLLPGESAGLPARAGMLALFAVLATLAVHARRAWPAARQWTQWTILAVAVIDLFASNRGTDAIPPFDAYAYNPLLDPILADAGFFRVVDEYQLKGHAGCGYGFRQVEGVTPYRLAAYQDFLDLAPEPVRWRLLGVKYVVAWRQALNASPPEETVAEAPSAPGAPNVAGITKVHRLALEPRRAFLVHDVRLAPTEEALYVGLAEPGFDPIATAFVAAETGLTPAVTEASASESVVVLDDKPGELELSVDAEAPGLLVVSETYYPGWQAWVDGQAVSVVRADGTFQAVPVDSGTHTVVLAYRPPILAVGALISALGIAICVFLLLAACRRGSLAPRGRRAHPKGGFSQALCYGCSPTGC